MITNGPHWFTSSYSNDQGGACVQGARLTNGVMAVRDSKNPTGPVLTLPAATWNGFLDEIRDVRPRS